jgi:hypothetical protein
MESFWQAHDRLLHRIEEERNVARMRPLPMAFLTFETSRHVMGIKAIIRKLSAVVFYTVPVCLFASMLPVRFKEATGMSI